MKFRHHNLHVLHVLLAVRHHCQSADDVGNNMDYTSNTSDGDDHDEEEEEEDRTKDYRQMY